MTDMKIWGASTTLPVARGRTERQFVDLLAARARAQGESVREVDTPLVAYVNHGRYVGDCACRAGVAIEPSWSVTGCLECFRLYRVIVWSDDMDLVAEALEVRPARATQNWVPGESVDVLIAENIGNGVVTADDPATVSLIERAFTRAAERAARESARAIRVRE